MFTLRGPREDCWKYSHCCVFNPVKGRAVAATVESERGRYGSVQRRKGGKGGMARELRIGLPEQMVTNRGRERGTDRGGRRGGSSCTHFCLKSSFLEAIGHDICIHLDYASVLKTGE